MMCLDVELLRRSGGTFGACNLMAEVVRRFAIHSDEAVSHGVDYRDVELPSKHAREAGAWVRSWTASSLTEPFLTSRRRCRISASNWYRMQRINRTRGGSASTPRERDGRVLISSFHAGSPLRSCTQVGDELLAVDGVRLRNSAHLRKLISAVGEAVELELTHEGILTKTTVTIPPSPQHGVTLKGKGNDRWSAWITTRQDR